MDRIRDRFRERISHLWQRLIVSILVVSCGRLQALSPASAQRFSAGFGRLAYSISGRSRRRTLANLYLAYGDALSSLERETLARRVFEHFGASIVAFLRAQAQSDAELSRRTTSEGWEHVAAVKAQGRGIIFCTAHFGNWEVLGKWVSKVQGYAMTAVAREPKSAALAVYLRQMREGLGYRTINKGESARDLLRALKRNEIVSLLPDQNSGDLFIPFFGVPAGTVAGPATLALHTGAGLIPIFCVQNRDGSFHVVCHPEIDTTPTGDKEADIVRVTTDMNRVIEETIRKHPDQWLWLHDRWKSAFEEKNRQRAWGDRVAEFEAARARWHI